MKHFYQTLYPKDWLILLLGLLSLIKVRVIGTFGLCEPIMVALLPYIIFKHRSIFRNRRLLILLSLCLLWLIGATISNIFNHSSDLDFLRGDGSIALYTAIIPVAYWCLYDKPKRVIYFFAGLAISAILHYYIQERPIMPERQAYKWIVYAFQYAIILIASLCIWKRRLSPVAYIILLSFGVWGLFHFSRNTFLVFTFATVLIFFAALIKKLTANPFAAQRAFNSNVFLLFVILGITFFGVKTTYEQLASSGSLGEWPQEKYELQKSSPVGLASGRKDFIISWEVIKESPLLGYGSYAKDKDLLAYRKARALDLLYPYEVEQADKATELFLPGHSHILGAWVYNGILGLPVWLYSLFLIALFFLKALYRQPSIAPILIVWSMLTVWDILFSPFANRPILAFFLCSILAILLPIKPNS